MASHTNYIGWLVSYSGMLGTVAGIMVTDYFFIRETKLDLQALYHRGGVYRYASGFNFRAVIALVVGATAAYIGLVVPVLLPLYNYAWFVGFFLSGGLYFFLMQSQRVQATAAS